MSGGDDPLQARVMDLMVSRTGRFGNLFIENTDLRSRENMQNENKDETSEGEKVNQAGNTRTRKHVSLETS